MRLALFFLLLPLLSPCFAREPMRPAYPNIPLDPLQPLTLSLHIPGLTSCTDNPDHSLRLYPGEPIYILVHGCFGSSGQFRGLAQVLAFHGQQTVCFTYDDRARLTDAAIRLRKVIDALSEQTRARRITVIGHSQGALIAHKSLTDLGLSPESPSAELRLVTISGPFDGIAAAKTCGRVWLYPLTLGLLPLSCYAVTGAKWRDITSFSRFIREPGTLLPQVSRYLKIDTDERAPCRDDRGGRCQAGRVVFSLTEQRNAVVEMDLRTRRVDVLAGHVEIVGDNQVAPMKLIAILQEHGEMPPTAPDRLPALDRLLAHLYFRESVNPAIPR